MNLTVVFIAAAVLLLWILPINAAGFSLLFFVAAVWLIREAHRRRAAGEAFTPLFRSMLWAPPCLPCYSRPRAARCRSAVS